MVQFGDASGQICIYCARPLMACTADLCVYRQHLAAKDRAANVIDGDAS
jgi:hypothetical protein